MTKAKPQTVLVTGGSGFFGEILVRSLVERGFTCVSIDLEPARFEHPNLISIQGDIRDRKTLEKLAKQHRFTAIFHLAAILAHAVKDQKFLWESNVSGTQNVAEVAHKFGVKKIVFTSSNCLWGHSFDRPVLETDVPEPVEIYGRSKLEGEKILLDYPELNVVIIRCPTIVDAGRLGLLAILLEFIDEGRKVWVVSGGRNRYQFIYAQDLVAACVKALDYPKTAVFNIGSDNVRSFRDVYNYVIEQAGSNARVASLPNWIIIPIMKLCYFLKLSPLGPYQYKMIAESFVFDTTKIKRELHWQPTLTNEQMLMEAYNYYHTNRRDIATRHDVSAHQQAAKMGVIRVLKWLS